MVWRLNEEGEISSGEHCFISDHDIVKKKFCLDHLGRWNPVGEWQYDKVISIITFLIINFYIYRLLNKSVVIKNIYAWKLMARI